MSSVIPIPARSSWPSAWVWLSSSPTSCAIWPRTAPAAASISHKKISTASAAALPKLPHRRRESRPVSCSLSRPSAPGASTGRAGSFFPWSIATVAPRSGRWAGSTAAFWRKLNAAGMMSVPAACASRLGKKRGSWCGRSAAGGRAKMDSKSLIVIGGGLAGLSSAVALAEAGFRLSLLESRPRLGGRATSYTLPTGEHVDNCQHVTMACCTNLEDFYRRVGAAGKIRYYDRIVFLDRLGRRGVLRRSFLPPPLHLAPSFLTLPFLDWKDKLGIGRAMWRIARDAGNSPNGGVTTMLEWLKAHGQTPAAIERVWRTVLISALDEELDRAAARDRK